MAGVQRSCSASEVFATLIKHGVIQPKTARYATNSEQENTDDDPHFKLQTEENTDRMQTGIGVIHPKTVCKATSSEQENTKNDPDLKVDTSEDDKEMLVPKTDYQTDRSEIFSVLQSVKSHFIASESSPCGSACSTDAVSDCTDATSSEQENADNDPDFKPDTSESDSEMSVVPQTDYETDEADSISILQSAEAYVTTSQSLPCASACNTATVCESTACLPDSTSRPAAASRTHQSSSIHVLDSSQTKFWVCMFCSVPQKKLPRHLAKKRPDEENVKEYLECKDQKMKKKLLAKMRNLGNHQHNVQVLHRGCGTLIVCHCPSGATHHSEFVPCPHCYGYFKGSLLYKHQCPIAETQKKFSSRLRKGLLLLPHKLEDNKTFSEFLFSLRTDPISFLARHDDLILQMMESEFVKHGHDKDKHNYVRAKGREMARLFKEARKISFRPDAEFKDFLSPDNLACLIAATQNLCGFDPLSQMYTNGSLVLKLGHGLKKCAALLQASALEQSNSELEQRTANFIKLLEMRWTTRVSHQAHRSLYERKRNKPCLLPLAEDVVLLSTSLQKKATRTTGVLSSDLDAHVTDEVIESWSTLCAVTLCQVILFNRRRQGEVSKMLLNDFKNRMPSHEESVVESSLSPLEQKLCKSLTRVEIVGKRGKTVPVLLTKVMKTSLDLLYSTRSKVGVPVENVYLFPRLHRGAVGHLRGSDCLRMEAKECGARHPEWLRTTKLRKQIATLAQIINLKEHEMDILANFMGHDLRIHRSFYRLPERAMQAAKISKLLYAVEQGTIVSFVGKTLDDITVSPDEEAEEEGKHLEEDAETGIEQTETFDTATTSGQLSSSVSLGQRRREAQLEQPGSDSGDCDVGLDQPESTKRRRERERYYVELASDYHDSDSERPKRIKKQGGGRKTAHRKWTSDECAAVKEHFAKFIMNKKLPGKTDIEKVMKVETRLSKRSWKNIKDFCRNTYKL